MSDSKQDPGLDIAALQDRVQMAVDELKTTYTGVLDSVQWIIQQPAWSPSIAEFVFAQSLTEALIENVAACRRLQGALEAGVNRVTS